MKFIILGLRHRGLWLSSMLAKRGFDVTWMNAVNKKNPAVELPWQVGTKEAFKRTIPEIQEFIKTHFKIRTQKGFQILTAKGPLELGGPFTERALEFFFKDNSELISQYMDAVSRKNEPLTAALEKKLQKLPLNKRWVLEWVTSLNTSHEASFKEGSREEFMDLSSEFLISDEDPSSIESCLNYAEKSGVKIVKETKIVDIGLEGSRISGVEIDDVKGFMPCDQIVFSCPSSFIQSSWPHVAKKLDGIKVNSKTPQYVWVKFGFKLRQASRPPGVFELSSFVMDPCVKLEGHQFGMLEWIIKNDHDIVKVWCKLKFDEAKKESVLQDTFKQLGNHLAELIPSFEINFKEASMNPEISEVNDFYVYPTDQKTLRGLYKKNLWFAGTETDARLDLISSFETEQRIYEGIIKNQKGMKSSNGNKVHSSRNGEAVVG